MIKVKKNKIFKRIFFDIETSFNVVACWQIGYKLNIGPESIIKERAIVCICWKEEGSKKVNYLTWNKGDDKAMLIKFAKIMNSADELIGHNSDAFDEKWIRTRCLKHEIPLLPDFKTVDTLKLSRKGFRFNSNKLDYISKFLGLKGKVETGGYQLWQDIIFKNSKTAMNKMVKYCQNDVVILEEVYNRLAPYIVSTSNKGQHIGHGKCSCSNCGSKHTISNGTRLSASGILKRRLQCSDCGSYFSVTEKQYNEIKEKPIDK